MRHNAKKRNRNRRLRRRCFRRKSYVKRKCDKFQKAKQIILDLIYGKKVAIIGNAESFYTKDWSKTLKEYDVIVRINAGICLTQ